MIRLLATCGIALIFIAGMLRDGQDADSPHLAGHWHLMSLISNGQPAPPGMLENASVEVSEKTIVFHMPAMPEYPDLQMRYKFVNEGIDLELQDEDAPWEILRGSWKLRDKNTICIAFPNDESVQTRPAIRPAKDVTFFEMRRTSTK